MIKLEIDGMPTDDINQETKVLDVEGLPVRHIASQATNCQARIIVLGNAYGLMPYQRKVASLLSLRGFDTYWFPFSGQEDIRGSFSLRSGVEDLRGVYSYITSDRSPNSSGPTRILAHCAGSLIALEYLVSYPGNGVDRLAIYGLLADPSRRRSFAEPKLRECGVDNAISDKEWEYNPMQTLSGIDIPVLFCHGRDKINRKRATPQEIRQAQDVCTEANIAWFDKGYDSDIDKVFDYMPKYTTWLGSDYFE